MKINFDRLTKGVLILSFLLIAFSFSYYCVIFLPQIEQARLVLQRQEQLAKEKQEHREYISKRKQDCYDIEQMERKKWNNVEYSLYDKEKDVCIVIYENKEWKEGGPLTSGVYNGEYKEGRYYTLSFVEELTPTSIFYKESQKKIKFNF